MCLLARPLAAHAARTPVPPVAPARAEGGRPPRCCCCSARGRSAPTCCSSSAARAGAGTPASPPSPAAAWIPEDGGPSRAALREAEEETGLDPAGRAA